MKALEEHEKQFVESNLCTNGNGFDIDKDNISLSIRKGIFDELINERICQIYNLEQKIDPYNFIYKFKTEEISPKDFRGNQNLLEFFENIRDDEIALKETRENKKSFDST